VRWIDSLEDDLHHERITKMPGLIMTDPVKAQEEIDRLKIRLLELLGPPDEEDTAA